MMDHLFIAIMAGGGGTRLWPLSRKNSPKHTLPLFGGKSLYQLTLDRVENLTSLDHLMIVTTEYQASLLLRLDRRMKRANFLIEPEPKGTANVAGIASHVALRADPDAVLALLPSDHLIQNVGGFRRVLESAYHVAEQGYLVTLGIRPTFPATGYGYLRKGNQIGVPDLDQAFVLEKFIEKPDFRRAQDMLEQGGHFWNSGMFFWKARKFLADFHRFMPQQSEVIQQIASGWKKTGKHPLDGALWSSLIPETVDYGVMEKSKTAALISAEEIGWNDLGSWESFYEAMHADERGNIFLHARVLAKDSTKALVYAENSDKLISLIGIDDIVIVDTNDALLVCRRQDAQKIKEIVRNLQESKQTNLL